MTDAKAAGEPSMEEILASIRQIINQNDKPADGVAPEVAPSTAPGALVPPPTSANAALVDEAPEEDEVLELTDILAEAPKAEIPAFEPAPVAATAATPVAAMPVAPTPPAPAMTPANPELISSTSAAAATAALSTLANTLQQERMEHSLPVGNGMRTLESMAVEALKPLLKEWLDANLPAIVERIVQQEVEKLTKRLGA